VGNEYGKAWHFLAKLQFDGHGMVCVKLGFGLILFLTLMGELWAM
jgi:hypothetical protein